MRARLPSITAVVACLLTLLVGLLFAARLPDPVASHWGLSGAPDGSMPRFGALLLTPAICAAVSLGASRAHPRLGWSVTAFAVTLAVLVQVQLVVSNYDVADWTDARSMGPEMFVALLALPCLAALVARRLVAGEPVEADRSSLGLGATERAVWSGTAGNQLLLGVALFGALVLVAGLGTGGARSMLAGVALLSAGLFARVRVRIARDGVHTDLGPGGLLRRHYPLERIAGARAERFTAPAWGYRGSRRMFGTGVIAVRRGDALRLDLTDGTALVVTVDDAATGAGLLNDLLARYARPL